MQKRLKRFKALISAAMIFTYVGLPVSTVRASLNSEKVRVMIEVEGNSTLEIAKDNNVSRSEANKFVDKVKEEQKIVIDSVEKLGGKVRYTFQNVINGISVDIDSSQIEKIGKIKKVKKVRVVKKYYPLLSTSKDLINVKSVVNKFNLKGEGTVVSVIDSGIDYTHKDMKIKDLSKIKIKKDSIKDGSGKWFSDKIPYGYNFADDNFEIIDKIPSMHGIHVAGIIGANGDDSELNKDKAVKGVAPEAQLFAMKVFSNKPDNKTAFSDDITMAIEDSVKKGADVINMSLGSDAGFVDCDDPEQKAIKAAVDSGVIVVVAGGNSSYSTDPDYPYMEDIDTGNISAPGLCKDALQVASMNNAKMICKAFDFKAEAENGKIPYYISEVDPVGTLKGDFQVIDCGYGSKEDFKNKDVKGKIVLVKKGHLNYVDKKLNAQNFEAAGIIVYNSEEDDSYVNMPIDPKVKIPAIFINNSDGKKIKKLMDSGVKISFNNSEINMLNSNKDMSGFSSWGCTPDLSFKPEVTAPGGNIYSTVNNNRYEGKSGTSMASPHVAGAMALLVQHLRSNEIVNKDRDFVNLAKNLVVNTAEPLIDKRANGLPYLTRQQGAGLVQIDKAIKNNIIVTDEKNSPVIELKEVGNSKSFKIKLKNLKDKEASFKINDKFGVLTNQTYYSDNFNRNCLRMRAEKLNGASVTFDKNQITVPANGEAYINVTLNIAETTMPDIFVEGFINLESKDNEQPNIGIPYMGFYGKWDRARIFDAPLWEETTFYGLTALLDKDGNCLGSYYNKEKQREDVMPEYISISPNGDKSLDEAIPHIAFLRNAREFKLQILDENKKVVRDIAIEKNMRKNNGINIDPISLKTWKWDGFLYNTASGKMEVAKEGKYYMRLSGKIDFDGASFQNLDIPVKVDLTAPKMNCETKKLSENKYNVQFNGKDDVAIKKYYIYYDNDEEAKYELDGTEKSVEIEVLDKVKKVTVKAMDFAGNTTAQDIINSKAIEIDNIPKYINKKDLNINYNISNIVDYVQITIDENKINNGKNKNYIIKDLTDGDHEITVDAYDKEGKVISGEKMSFIVDTRSPEVNILSPSKDKEQIVDGQEKYLVKFNVKEALPYSVYINDKKIASEDKATLNGKDFEYDFDLGSGQNEVNIKIEDAAGNIFNKKFILNVLENSIININNIKNNQTILGKSVDIFGGINFSKKVIDLKINDEKVGVDDKSNFNYHLSFENYGNKQIVLEANIEGEKASRKIINLNLSPIKLEQEIYYTKGYSINIPYALDKNNMDIDSVNIIIDDKRTITNSENDTSINIDKIFEGEHKVVFNVLDKNKKIIGTKDIVVNVDNGVPVIISLKDEKDNDLNKKFILNRDDITLIGELNEEVDYLKINRENADVIEKDGEYKFSKKLHLKEGLNLIKFEIKDKSGNITQYANKIYSDITAPVLKVQPNEEKILLKNEKEVILNITGEDNTFGYDLYVNDSLVDKVYNEAGNGENTKKEIKYKVNIPGDKAIVKVKLVDNAGNVSERVIQFYREDVAKDDFIINNMTVDKSFKKGEEAKATIQVVNNTSVERQATVVIGLYDTNIKKMVRYSYINKNIKAKDIEKMEAGFSIPNEGNYIIKTMIWDNIENMNALGESIKINVE